MKLEISQLPHRQDCQPATAGMPIERAMIAIAPFTHAERPPAAREQRDRASAKAHRRELKSLTQSLRRDWRAWNELCGVVLARSSKAGL